MPHMQAASRQLAAGGQAEAVRTTGELERLERELAAARSAHGRAVEAGNKVRLFCKETEPTFIESIMSRVMVRKLIYE